MSTRMKNIKSTTKNLITCKVRKTRSKRSCEATTFSKAGSTSAPHWQNPAELGTVTLTPSQLEGMNPNVLKSVRSFHKEVFFPSDWETWKLSERQCLDEGWIWRQEDSTGWQTGAKSSHFLSLPAKIFYSRTPHESLPMEKSSFRQFFRLVTSQVSLTTHGLS